VVQRVEETALDYREFKARLEQEKPRVLELVRDGERLIAAPADDERPTSMLPALADEFPFSARVWDVWIGNTRKMRGVKRIDLLPYATHPTRMALFCYWILEDEGSARDDAAVLALLHDYLEEGGGIRPETIAAMRDVFPEEPRGVLAAIVLSEPDIAYDRLGSEAQRSFWMRVAYLIQAVDAMAHLRDPTFANAALADKLDNLHDFGYIEHNPKLSPARRSHKLAQRLAYFAVVGEALRPWASTPMYLMLKAATSARAEALKVPADLVAVERATLEAARRDHGERILEMIREYQRVIGLVWG